MSGLGVLSFHRQTDRHTYTIWQTVFEVNNNATKRTFISGPNKRREFLCFWQIWMLSTTPWHLSHVTRNKYTTRWTRAYNSNIRDNTERQRHLHKRTPARRHTHSPPAGCIFQSCLSAVFWSPQCSLMITLSPLLSSAFKLENKNICLFIYPSFTCTPQLSGSLRNQLLLNVFLLPNPEMKERRSTVLGNGKEKRMKEESTKEK